MSFDLRGRRRPLAGAPALVWALVLAAGTLGALGVLGCGKKGDPAPPFRAVPAPIADLVVLQRGNRLLFQVTHPKTTVAGQALSGLARVELWEVIKPLASAARIVPPVRPAAPPVAGQPATPAPGAPPAAPPAEPAPGAAPPSDASGATGTEPITETIAEPPAAAATPVPEPETAPAAAPAPGPAGERLAPLDPRELNAAAKRILVLEPADIANSTAGDRLLFDLPLPDPMPGEEARYYAVRTIGPTGEESAFSNQVVIAPRTPPAPPARTAVVPQGDGVLVEWDAPAAAAATAPMGYHVYRRSAQARAYGAPLHFAGPGETRFLDSSARFGESYIYAVTAVTRRAPVGESAIQSEHEVRFQDRFPPPPPRDLVALPGGGRVRLVWRSSEGDAAGYLVYRRQAGEFVRLTATPIQELEYSDRDVAAGAVRIYRVTAVDAAGNESEPVQVQAQAE